MEQLKESKKLWNIENISNFLENNDTWLYFCKSHNYGVHDPNSSLLERGNTEDYFLSKFVFTQFIHNYKHFTSNKLGLNQIINFIFAKHDEVGELLYQNNVIKDLEHFNIMQFDYVTVNICQNIFLTNNIKKWHKLLNEVKIAMINDEMNDLSQTITETKNKKNISI